MNSSGWREVPPQARPGHARVVCFAVTGTCLDPISCHSAAKGADVPQEPKGPKESPKQPEPMHDPSSPPLKDPPAKPMHDPAGDPTYEPQQPFGDPTPTPGQDPQPQNPEVDASDV